MLDKIINGIMVLTCVFVMTLIAYSLAGPDEAQGQEPDFANSCEAQGKGIEPKANQEPNKVNTRRKKLPCVNRLTVFFPWGTCTANVRSRACYPSVITGYFCGTYQRCYRTGNGNGYRCYY